MKKNIVLTLLIMPLLLLLSCNNIQDDMEDDNLEYGKFNHSKYSKSKFTK